MPCDGRGSLLRAPPLGLSAPPDPGTRGEGWWGPPRGGGGASDAACKCGVRGSSRGGQQREAGRSELWCSRDTPARMCASICCNSVRAVSACHALLMQCSPPTNYTRTTRPADLAPATMPRATPSCAVPHLRCPVRRGGGGDAADGVACGGIARGGRTAAPLACGGRTRSLLLRAGIEREETRQLLLGVGGGLRVDAAVAVEEERLLQHKEGVGTGVGKRANE